MKAKGENAQQGKRAGKLHRVHDANLGRVLAHAYNYYCNLCFKF